MKNKKIMIFFIMIFGLYLISVSNVFAAFAVDYNYTGGQQTWTVPVGVTSVQIECWGAGTNGGNYADGGYAKGTKVVTSGQTLYIYVGGTNGYNGGGSGINGSENGGGATDVRIGGTALVNRVIVAGGAGGLGAGDSYGYGGNGGGTSGDAGGASSTGGVASGGTQISGYQLGIGENGLSDFFGGGGGGGGYYGGYGGYGAGDWEYGGGGGGGSSYITGLANASTTAGIRTGDGLVRITVATAIPGISISSPSTAFTVAGPVTYTVTYDEYATTISLRDQDITLNKTGTADGVVTVTNGTTNTPTVTISGITGEGTLGISVAASRAWDATPNYAPAAGPSTTFTVDNIAPEVPTIDVSPSTSTNTDVIVTITYPGDASTKEYKIGAESWTSYTVAVTITINSTVYARCYDNAGNPSTQSSISIVNIDKTAPSAPIVDITTGTYSVAQTVTVIDPGAVDVAHTYYTLDGTEPDNTDTEVIGTMLVDGASVTVMLKLVSYDNAGNKGAITTEEYTFTDGPTITVDITGRIKDESDINVEIIVAAESGIDSWEYEWSENTTPTGSWISGVTDTQTLTQTANGIWYLHIRATDNDTNVVTVRYGIYKKGVVQVIEGYIEGTEKQDRKNFRYYIGKDNNGINKIMLVAGNHGGSVAQTLEKDDVLDINNKFKDGVFYIDREGKIQQY